MGGPQWITGAERLTPSAPGGAMSEGPGEEDRAAQARRIEAHLVWDREVESRLRGFDPAATFGPPPPLHP